MKEKDWNSLGLVIKLGRLQYIKTQLVLDLDDLNISINQLVTEAEKHILIILSNFISD